MTIETINLVKKELINPAGKFFNEYTKLITNDADVYQIMKDGSKKILLKFRKSVISKDLQLLSKNTFEKHSKKINKQRGKASGGKLINVNKVTYSTEPCRSAISGSFDNVPIHMKNKFNTNIACRLTSFTKNNSEKWELSIPFFERIAYLYSILAPDHYEKQMNAISKVNELFRIGNTPFTTVTSNYNFRTACHKDNGDYTEGLGNLTIVGDDFGGGYLLFPEFEIAIDVKAGDFILMDVHEYHCNTLLNADDNHIRLSFVCYLREKMIDCNKKVVINEHVYYFK